MGEEAVGDQAALGALQALFADDPDLLKIVTARDLESRQLLDELRERDNLLAGPVRLYVVGRTHAGKTSIGNRLFGADVMKSTGHMDCTDFIGMLRLRSNLHYFDTPGAGSREKYENWTRLALGLRQLADAKADHLDVLDFTDSWVGADGVVAGVLASEYTPREWEAALAGEYAPDAVVYVVAPHMLFLRDDRQFLDAMLRKHGPKLVIAFNDWAGLTTDAPREDAANAITALYATVFPGGPPRPRFVRVNALNGAGMSELTSEICQVVAPEKLGSMRQVLDGELKDSAQRARSRWYRSRVNRIAARLAMHTVDQKFGEQNLIGAAAAGVCQYGVLTFEAEDRAAELNEEVGGLLDSRIRAVLAERQEEIKVKEAQTGTRELTERVPVIEKEQKTTTKRMQVRRQVQESTGVGFGDVVDAYMDAGIRHVGAFLRGASRAEQVAITDDRKRRTVRTTTRTVMDDVDIPVTEIREKVTGYTTKVVGTVEEVVGMTERVVGTKALRGGIPVIELLAGVGLGVEAYCTAGQNRSPADTYMDTERDKVRLILDRAALQIEPLLQQGGTAEPALTDLLDGLL